MIQEDTLVLAAPAPAPVAGRLAFAVGAAACTVALCAAPLSAQQHEAQQHSHGDERHGHSGLHFSHPLIAESPTPDRKVRLDYLFFDHRSGEAEHSLQGGAEWPFHRSFSIEVAVPYSVSESALGFTQLTFKVGNNAFAERGVFLGYGLGLGLPTSGGAEHEEHTHDAGEDSEPRGALVPGSAIGTPSFDGVASVHAALGHDHYEIEPFFDIGYRRGRWELAAFGTFVIPTNMGAEPAENQFAYNLSALYRASPWLQLLLESDGHTHLNGAGAVRRVARIDPGLKVRPLHGRELFLGAAAMIPVTHDRDFNWALRISALHHF